MNFDMNPSLPQNIPPIWVLQRREYLETYQVSLRELSAKLLRVSGINSLASIMKAIKQLEQFYEYLDNMENTLRTYTSSQLEYSHYKINHILRIKELVSLVISSLDVVTRQISSGVPFISSLDQAKRNLWHMDRLMEETVNWLGKVS